MPSSRPLDLVLNFHDYGLGGSEDACLRSMAPVADCLGIQYIVSATVAMLRSLVLAPIIQCLLLFVPYTSETELIELAETGKQEKGYVS